jgi:hypothetical protein
MLSWNYNNINHLLQGQLHVCYKIHVIWTRELYSVGERNFSSYTIEPLNHALFDVDMKMPKVKTQK